MENLIKMDDLGVPLLFGNIHILHIIMHYVRNNMSTCKAALYPKARTLFQLLNMTGPSLNHHQLLDDGSNVNI